MIFALLIYRVFSVRIEDKIDYWIGVDYQFPSYSGVIDLGDVNQKVIHYVFMESQNQPATDPLIIWLGGGPGCTSLFGLAGDIGPFVFDGNNDNLINNPFSLIKKANLLFIETPAGVGYSTINDVNFKFDDTINGQDNLLFLQKWFVLFNEYINHNIWIGGASYAGMYVPFFAKQIVDSSTYKLKGIMVGNGVIVEGGKFILDTYNQYMLQRSFYDIKTQAELQKICPKYPNSVSCKYAQGRAKTARENIDIYDVYGTCYGYSENDNINNSPPCVDSGNFQRYFNKPEVKAKLHVTKDFWASCSKDVFDAFQFDKDGCQFILAELAQKNIKILEYSGNLDASVGMIYTEQSINQIPGIKLVTKRKPFANKSNNNLAGWVTEYNYLRFVVLRSAGHLAASYQRENAYQMFSDFLGWNA